jgi:hypothetical protein
MELLRKAFPGTPAEARAMLEGAGVDSSVVERLMGGHAAEIFQLPVTV